MARLETNRRSSRLVDITENLSWQATVLPEMILKQGNRECLVHTWLIGFNINRQTCTLIFAFLEQFGLPLMRRLFYHLLNSIAGPEQTGRVPRELSTSEIYELLPLVHERHRLVPFSPSDERVNEQSRKPFSNPTMTVLSETPDSLNFSQATPGKSDRSASERHFLYGRRIVPSWNALLYTPEPKQEDRTNHQIRNYQSNRF